ncbi:MAG: hypothetical protein PHG06_19745 [Parabacteroides sp.]|nr:hypothetical protein [Parabacteroides sp.]
MAFSAQNSITIKRLRSSDSLILTFGNNGIPFFQAIDEVSGAISPNWEVAENQPVRIPTITSVRGLAVNVLSHKWSYNGTELLFNGAESGGWTTDSTGKFRINANGHIKIVKNLASAVNIAGDVLSYTVQVSVAGVEYSLSSELDIVIQKMGASSYYTTILADTESLSSDVLSTNITTKLFQGVTEITSYHTKWYKDFVEWPDKVGQKNITVTRDDISGAQLFIVEMCKTSAAGEPILAKAGIRIIDVSDEYKVIVEITSSNKMVSDGNNVTVKASIINMKTGSIYSPADAIWKLDVMDRENWLSLKTSATNSIEVTPLETDRNGNYYDVDVMAEVTFS